MNREIHGTAVRGEGVEGLGERSEGISQKTYIHNTYTQTTVW